MNDPTPFGTALHDRVRDEHTDLDELVRASTRAGTWIRRRRRTGAGLAAAGSVAAVAVGVALLGAAGSPSGSSGLEPGPAMTPSVSAPTTINELERLAPVEAEGARLGAKGEPAPFRVDAPGWQCSEPADEKLSRTHGDAVVSVHWRPADYWADYQDPAKAGGDTYVSEVHGRYFATVSPGPGTTPAQVDEVGQALIWAE